MKTTKQLEKRPFQIFGVQPTGGAEILLNDISVSLNEANMIMNKLQRMGCYKLRIESKV